MENFGTGGQAVNDADWLRKRLRTRGCLLLPLSLLAVAVAALVA